MEIEENEDEKIEIVEIADDVFFNDDKFTLLAEQILDEKCSYSQTTNTYINDHNNSKYFESGFEQKSKQQTQKQQQQQKQESRSCSFYKKNIWAEPSTKTTHQFISRTTLGGLL